MTGLPARPRPGARLASWLLVAARGDTAGGFGKVVILPLRTMPGKHRLQLRMSTYRPGLSKNAIGRKQVQSVDGELTVPGEDPGGVLSDLGFLWPGPVGSDQAAVARTHRETVPNPERLYGLYADSLRAEFITRSRAADTRA